MSPERDPSLTPPRRGQPICVTGMHRSGTSMVARMLNLAGVDLGPAQELHPPGPDNTEGYWENQKFVEVSTQILAKFGGGWDLPPFLPPGWLSDPRIETERTRAQELIERFRGVPVWAWKDPRCALVLPFWMELLPGLKVVVCLRHPLEVAQSLKRRGFSSPAFAYGLWLTYNRALGEGLRTAQRIVTHYDAYFLDAQAELSRVLGFLGARAPTAEIALAAAAAHPPRRRHHSGLSDLSDPSLPPEIVQTYLGLCEAAGPVFLTAHRDHLSKAGIQGAGRASKPPQAGVRRADAASTSIWEPRHEHLLQDLSFKLEMIARLEEELAAARREARSLAEAAKQEPEQLAQASESVSDLGLKGGQAQTEAGRLARELEAVQENLAQAQERAKQLESELVALQGTVKTMQQEMVDLLAGAGVRLILKLRKALEVVLPLDSPQRKVYEVLMAPIRFSLGPRRRAPGPVAASRAAAKPATDKIAAPAAPVAPLEQNPTGHAQAYRDGLAAAKGTRLPEYVELEEDGTVPLNPPIKLIAFYLPQFHPIPENDEWWGKGFTEWTNVAKAMPQFRGHYQPRLPGELGFYDLRLIEVQRRQIELARMHGIYGFAFHYYWFGGKRLLERPLDMFLANPDLDMPFCLCWANENWTRAWDGMEDQVLIRQPHAFDIDRRLIESIEPALRDPRYIRIEGKPLVIVYRAPIMEDAVRATEMWKRFAEQKGLGGLFLVAAQTFGMTDPRPFGFDAAVQFPPHNIMAEQTTQRHELLNPEFEGKIFEYEDMAREALAESGRPPYERFRCVVPSWDNEARRPGRGHVFGNSDPDRYRAWLEHACVEAMQAPPERRFVFINSWNEWAEGAYLEPDRRFGYAYLAATTKALRMQVFHKELISKPDLSGDAVRFPQQPRRHDTAVIAHVSHRDVWPVLARHLEVLRQEFALFVSIPEEEDESLILQDYPHAGIIRVPNRGRDILPFLRLLTVVCQQGYAHALKIHSKKAVHGPDGDFWWKDSLGKLLGSDAAVQGAKRLLAKGGVGMVAAEGHVFASEHPPAGLSPGGPNLERLLGLARLAGLDSAGARFTFVAGSMFWFIPDHLSLLTRFPIAEWDFEPEVGQRDGTLAHAFEMFFGMLVSSAGVNIAEVDTQGHGGPPSYESIALRPSDPHVLRLRDQRPSSSKSEFGASGPVVVYQMGRVGSVSVFEALKRAKLDVPLYHAHLMNHLDRIEAEVRRTRPNPTMTLAMIEGARKLRRIWDRSRDETWSLITLVREPVARNVSAFFLNLEEFLPAAKPVSGQWHVGMDELMTAFLGSHAHNAPADWFDSQVKDLIGIDVLAQPFPFEAGFCTYEGTNARLLVLRTEDLDRCGESAIASFLGLTGLELSRENDAAAKPYAHLYERFKRGALPREYVVEMYSSRFARHFYHPDELAEFERRWTTPRPEAKRMQG